MNNPFTAIVGLTAGDPRQDEKAMTIVGAAVVIKKSEVLRALHPALQVACPIEDNE